MPRPGNVNHYPSRVRCHPTPLPPILRDERWQDEEEDAGCSLVSIMQAAAWARLQVTRRACIRLHTHILHTCAFVYTFFAHDGPLPTWRTGSGRRATLSFVSKSIAGRMAGQGSRRSPKISLFVFYFSIWQPRKHSIATVFDRKGCGGGRFLSLICLLVQLLLSSPEYGRGVWSSGGLYTFLFSFFFQSCRSPHGVLKRVNCRRRNLWRGPCELPLPCRHL